MLVGKSLKSDSPAKEKVSWNSSGMHGSSVVHVVRELHCISA